MTLTAGDLHEIAGRYLSVVQRGGHERTGRAYVAQRLKIVATAHPSRSVDTPPICPPGNIGDTLEIGAFRRADARERHDDDALRPETRIIEQRAGPQKNLAAEIEREHEVVGRPAA
jgi:hypothetical protein